MNQKITILFVITSTGVGGAEKIVACTVRGLSHTRYHPVLCSLKRKGETAGELEREGVTVYSLDMPDGDTLRGWWFSLKALLGLVLYCRRTRPTIIHSFLFRANMIARLAGFITRVPLVISSVRVMGGEKNYYHAVEKATSGMVDHYITVSESVRTHLVRRAGVSPVKVTTIYNGVSTGDRCASSHGVHHLPKGLTAGDRFLLSVGRLHRQKGYDDLIKAFARVRQGSSALKLLIVGEGEEENNLKNLVKTLDLSDHIIFAGLLLKSDAIFPLAELVVLSSLWEGLPNVLLEAMSAGKPVVATAVGGVPELVVDGETGLLVPPRDPASLAAAILDLCRNPSKAHTMGAAGRVRVREHFSLPAMIDKTERLYQELLARKRLL